MGGYVKIANEVFRKFRKISQRHVAFRLYELADDERWKPFRCADSYLMEEGVSKRDIRNVLGDMESLGLLVVIKPGDRNNARVIQVKDPAPKLEPQLEPQLEPRDVESADHADSGSNNVIEESDPRSLPSAEPRSEPQLELKNQTTEKTAESEKKKAAFAAVLAALNEHWRPAIGMQPIKLSPSKGQGKHLQLMINKSDPLRVQSLFRWLARSRHDRATFYRDKSMGTKTILGHLDELLDLAENSGQLHRAAVDPTQRPDAPDVALRKAEFRARKEARLAKSHPLIGQGIAIGEREAK